MSRADASKKINTEATKLSPSSLITFFEIDISDIVFENQLSDIGGQTLFRFHNNLKLTFQNIIWQGNDYIAAPITATDFEISSKGTLPTPKFSISVSDSGINALSTLKSKINQLGDLIGAKVTRIRTFAKYLDEENFTSLNKPEDYDEDPLAEFPRDIYFIDRKINENKRLIEYQLVTRLDLENLKLPARQVIADRCMWNYRGEGCLYEFKTRRNDDVHGTTSTLFDNAPPVATDNDESIYGQVLTEEEQPIDKGEWAVDTEYTKGDYIFIERSGLKYYFVAIQEVPKDKAPPNTKYWVADQCSKLTRGCRLRHGTTLPYGGYPAASKVL